jgi:hypothetical protein
LPHDDEELAPEVRKPGRKREKRFATEDTENTEK